MKLEIKDRYLHPVSTEVGFVGTSNKDMNIAVFEPDDKSMTSEKYAKTIVDRWNAFEEGGLIEEVLQLLGHECGPMSCAGCYYESYDKYCTFYTAKTELIEKLQRLFEGE